MTARLIVHADDFGRSVGLTEAVAEAFERGILTSASIVAAGPEFERAAALARVHPELDVGVHLAIDEYPPIAELDASAGEGFDLVLGLGITPYVSDEEFERLAQLIGPAAFVLDYHAAGLTPKNALHWVYRKLVRFPFYRLFSDDEIAGLLGRLGVRDFEIAKEPGLSFVQRLPA